MEIHYISTPGCISLHYERIIPFVPIQYHRENRWECFLISRLANTPTIAQLFSYQNDLFLLAIIPRSVLASDHEHTLRDLFLWSRSQLTFMPLVPRGHDCHIVIFIKLAQVNSEGNVFVRFIKKYLGGNDMRWVILQCNIPASLPMIKSIIYAAYSLVLVIPNPNINFIENVILFIIDTITLPVNT